MPGHKRRHTQRKYKSLRKTLRKTLRNKRKTLRRKGGVLNECVQFSNHLNNLRGTLNQQNEQTITDFLEKVRTLYNTAQRAQCNQMLLDEIEAFELNEVVPVMNQLLA